MWALNPDEIIATVRSALEEDVGTGDVTTLATIPASHQASARMVARESLVLAGIAFGVESLRAMSTEVRINPCAVDGQRLSAQAVLLELQGPARALLSAERVALNFVQRLSGIATLTAQYVDAVRGTRAQILDTRKTTPGWRRWEKYAVVCGGGRNHRFGLSDQVLIKDNHLAALSSAQPNPVAAAVRLARSQYPSLKVEVETDTVAQAAQAVEAGADIILLDNMSLDELRAAVELVRGRALTEASGGVNLGTVRAIAETGVDYISVGALTHSARSMDIALDFGS